MSVRDNDTGMDKRVHSARSLRTDAASSKRNCGSDEAKPPDDELRTAYTVSFSLWEMIFIDDSASSSRRVTRGGKTTQGNPIDMPDDPHVRSPPSSSRTVTTVSPNERRHDSRPSSLDSSCFPLSFLYGNNTEFLQKLFPKGCFIF